MSETTINIKNLSGQTIATAIVTESAISHEELMTSDYVQLSWNADTGTILPAGAYIDYGGERYSLLEPYTPTRANEAEYQYTPQFQSRIMAWQKHPVPVYTYEDDGQKVKTREFDWEFTGSPADAMYMVQQAIRNETGEQWTVQLADSLPATISLSSQSADIFSLLNDIAGQCGTEWWADKATDTLYLSQCKHGTPVALTVGGNVKVPSITASKDGYFTRFYVFGSSRNVTQDSGAAATNSIVNRRLTLDPATYPGGYIDVRTNLQPGEIFTTTLYFDDIYPSSKLAISDVRARLKYRLDSNGNRIQSGTGDDGQPVYEQYAIWYFQIANFDFDPADIIEGMDLSASFETGQLAGRDFELAYHKNAETVNDTADVTAFNVKAGDFEIIIDESTGTILPGLAYIIPQDGDQVILYNIEMPAEYTASARQELAEAALAEIAKRTADNNSYEMDSNPVQFHEDGTDLSLGQAVTFTNGGTTLSTRVLMVEKHLDYAYQQRIRVGNEIIKGNTQQLREEVTQASQNIDILAAFNNLSSSVSNAYAKVQREMLEGFARIGNMWKFDPDDPTVIYSDFSAYVNGFLSAKGLNPDAGATPSGATTLGGLSNVGSWADGIAGKDRVMVQLAGSSSWTAMALADIAGGLDEEQLAEYLTQHQYTTQEWITQQGYATQSWANGQFAKATVAINAGTGLTGGGTLSASRTLSLATVGTAGTYTKVTVDAYGRVTGHQSLAAADIPTLSISKVSGLQSALDEKLDASAFSDLFEKVALSGGGYAIRAKYGLYSDDFISTKGQNADAGSAVAGVTELSKLTDVTISNPQDGQGLVYRNGTWKNETVQAGVTDAYTKAEADSRFVNASGDTMTGALTINSATYPQIRIESTGNKGIYFKNGDMSEGIVAYYRTVGMIIQCGDHYININEDGAAFVDNKYTIWHSGNDGNSSGLDADLLDGKHYSDITNGNVASATRLQTARTLWGQSFNGTGNVSGSLTGVTSIDATSYIRAQSFYLTGGGGLYYVGGTTYLDGMTGSNVRIGLSYGEIIPVLTLHATTTKLSGSLQIGNGTISWDSTNNCFHFSNGLYSDGFISTKGANPDAGGTVPGGGGTVNIADIEGMADEWKVILSVSDIPDTMSRWPTWAEVTGKPSWIGSTKPSYTWSEISGKPSTFTPSSHTHTLSQINDLHSSWDSYLKSAPSFATTSSNVYSATRLQTARTIWGQSFNGTANVSGAISGATTITASGNIKGLAFYLTEGGGLYYVSGTTYLDGQQGKNFQIRTSGGTSIPKLTIYATTTQFNGTAYATGGFQNGSDIRYKHILRRLSLTADQVAAAPAFLFRWTDGTDRALHAGTSAQYWQTVLPQVVMEGGDGRLSMQYGVAALMGTIAVARTVTDHEERIKRLEKMIS